MIQRILKLVDNFNFEVDDIKNQLDTTDTYIENYLPLRNLKEVTYLLENCLDRKTSFAIQEFEAERIKELYAKMLQTVHKIPDFKTRLVAL